MDQNKKVEYYTQKEAIDGFYPDKPNQYDTTKGVLLGFGHIIKYIDGKPYQITEAIIEDPNTKWISHIDYQLLKKICD
ncbi:hypothetical protein FACS1894159_10520 [Bacteroidia bacterium]|nr:hypothetical protein FACS1894159_10520 [Bacteroidia bacterium]